MEGSSEVCIVGSSGLVGSHIRQWIPDATCFTSKNIQDLKNREFDIIYVACIPAVKWLANMYPINDLEVIQGLLDIIATVRCRQKCVLISTIDVYDPVCVKSGKCTEHSVGNPLTNHPYGKHRRYVEVEFERMFQDKLRCFRLPGLFGFGLKKNIIFDFIKNPDVLIDTRNSFQWYCLDWLTHDLERHAAVPVPDQPRYVNLFPEPLPNADLVSVFAEFRPTVSKVGCTSCACVPQCANCCVPHCGSCPPATVYDVKTSFPLSTPLEKRYQRPRSAVKGALRRFLRCMLDNRLNISTLAFTDHDSVNEYRDALGKFGVKSLEGVPARDLDTESPWRMPVYSLQALFFGCDSFNVFVDPDPVFDHLCHIIDRAVPKRIKILVFGAPKVRRVPESMTYQEAEGLMILFCRRVAEYIRTHHPDQIVLALEPNATEYKCNFLVNSVQGEALVRKVDCPEIRLVLDTGCMFLEREDFIPALDRCMDVLCHVHFSAPHLASLNVATAIPFSYLYNWLLGHSGFHQKRITIEMLGVSPGDLHESIRAVVREPVVHIAGGGWFGSHAAKRLMQSGRLVQVHDGRGVFSGSSYFNQNRLHLGFHYPRSYATRMMCREHFVSFRREYGFAVRPIPDNIYGVSKKSQIDFTTFLQIMRASHLAWTHADKNAVSGCDGAIRVKEMFIDHQVMKTYFESLLKNVLNRKDLAVGDENNKDLLLDCTNNTLFVENNDNWLSNEATVSLIYKCTSDDFTPRAWTIMDGDFVSLFPLDMQGRLYSLTHVAHSPQKGLVDSSLVEKIRPLFEEGANEYIPDFSKNFVFVDYFVSKKAKQKSSCASRNLVVSTFQNVVSISAGKITAVYDLERTLAWLL